MRGKLKLQEKKRIRDKVEKSLKIIKKRVMPQENKIESLQREKEKQKWVFM